MKLMRTFQAPYRTILHIDESIKMEMDLATKDVSLQIVYPLRTALETN